MGYLLSVEIMKQRLLIFIIFLSLLFISFISTNIMATNTDIVQQFAPILYFEKDEECFPVDVGYHINNSYLHEVDNDQIIDKIKKQTQELKQEIKSSEKENPEKDRKIKF